jgi:hypothetical protein
MQRVSHGPTLEECLANAAAVRDIEAAAAAHEAALGADPRPAALRHLIQSDVAIGWQTETLRSLWLVSHRGLRRAGVRAHPESLAVLVGWRGEGLVLLRAAGARRSVTLVPWRAVAGTEDARHVIVPAGTPYDTLADAGTWHMLAFHSHPGAGLARRQLAAGLDGESWIEQREEEPS